MKPIIRFRWQSILVLTMMVGVILSWLWISKMNERKELVGKTDTVSKFRCRFTVPSDWQATDNLRRVAVLSASSGVQPLHCWSVPSHVLEDETFTPLPGPIRLWMDNYVLHRRTDNSPSIHLSTLTGTLVPWQYQINGGYPQPVVFDEERPLTRRLCINGYRATVVTDPLKPGEAMRKMWLLVYVPHHSILYEVSVSAETSDFAPLDREMQAIVASYHIEKVAGSAGDKR
ncbi:MAG: hypothetical protein JWN14_4255 [Chthonomonadales bacterium]|nr:hypothetical protein [Chthonomonadales bacterium]